MSDWSRCEDDEEDEVAALAWMDDHFSHTRQWCPCGVKYIFQRCYDPSCPVWLHTIVQHRELESNA